MKAALQIKDVISATGLSRETLRFYESRGLLPEVKRSPSGYRQFSRETIIRLKFIKRAQEVGFSLQEIRDLLKLGQEKALTKKDLQKIAASQIAKIDERIAGLKEMRTILFNLSEMSPGEYRKATCPILSELNFTEG